MSCPKSVIGHPETIKKTGFPIKDFGNDGQINRVYTQTLIKFHHHSAIDLKGNVLLFQLQEIRQAYYKTLKVICHIYQSCDLDDPHP